MSRPVGPVDDQLSVVSKSGDLSRGFLLSRMMSTVILIFDFIFCTINGSGPPPVNVSEYERHAHSVLPRNAYGYYGSGANDMITLRENR